MEPTRPSRLLYMPWKVVSAVPVTPGGLALVGGVLPGETDGQALIGIDTGVVVPHCLV